MVLLFCYDVNGSMLASFAGNGSYYSLKYCLEGSGLSRNESGMTTEV